MVIRIHLAKGVIFPPAPAGIMQPPGGFLTDRQPGELEGWTGCGEESRPPPATPATPATPAVRPSPSVLWTV